MAVGEVAAHAERRAEAHLSSDDDSDNSDDGDDDSDSEEDDSDDGDASMDAILAEAVQRLRS